MYESRGVYPCKILVSAQKGFAYLVEAPKEVTEGVDGLLLEDNDFRNIPEKPGVYLCRVEFFFQQGYSEGYQADGESEWHYEIISAVPQEALAIEARLKELEERHEADTKKLADEAERNNILQASLATAKERCLAVTKWFKEILKTRPDLPPGFAPQLTEQIRVLSAVLSDEHGWSRYYKSEFDDMERHSLEYDYRQIAKKVLGMEIKDGEYVPTWQIVGNLEHRMKLLTAVLEAAKAVRDAYQKFPMEAVKHHIGCDLAPAIETFEAAFEQKEIA